MNRRNLILGSMAVLLSGCAKESKNPIKRNVKLKVVKEDYQIIIDDSEDIEDILDTIPLYIKSFKVGNRTVDIDDLVIYPVKKGDSLSKIAERFYGSLNDWREVYELNKGVRKLVAEFNPQYLPYLIGDNPNKINEGQLIFLEKAVEDLTLPEGRGGI